MSEPPHFPLRLYLEPLFPFLLVTAAMLAVMVSCAELERHRPPPSQRIFIPREWTCYSKYRGGLCERTGGIGPNGPWGTEKPPR